ncbi:hypothetical protein CHS0354_041863 [Potamilus streckersoni]|uniref:Alpha-1,3-mannosyl-glycoprotein 4-beta-N-acetylglucosaminyltransferase A n=1 Tax=Potamilus streckersoni TaxID=2493646 RepID=A0AAE0W236_9BIVA|nr:hypothetical protein CHS0354_041863 [Potamilus streckersoni]
MQASRMKNVIFTVIFLCVLTFFWIIAISREDGSMYREITESRLVDLQERMHRVELLSHQRENDLQMLSSQFTSLLQIISHKQDSVANGSDVEILSSFLDVEKNSSLSDSLHLPSIFTYLPHLLQHPDSLKPAYRLSRNRFGASIVLGIPTIRREGVSYLCQTVQSLIDGMTEEEQIQCLIVVFVAEPWDKTYIQEVGDTIQSQFPESVNKGLVEVVGPPAEFYPDMNNLKITFGDTRERVKWRTKQNLDFCFLMLYARTRGIYYVQLEDDLIAKPGYFSIMKTYADQQRVYEWILLEFSTLGFIGKLFKSSDLPIVVEFFLMFYKDKPIDWLLDHLLWVKVCSPEKDDKHCVRMKAEAKKRFRPSLFQHVGMQSSLKGKIQKLKDKDFGKQAIHRAHVNPPASLHTSIKTYQKFTLQKAYIGEDIFWGVSPVAGDTVEIVFNPYIQLQGFLFRSGSMQHPDDKFLNTTVEILPEFVFSDTNETVANKKATYVAVGEFNKAGVAKGDIDPLYGKIQSIRLRVLQNSQSWVLLNEIHLIQASQR